MIFAKADADSKKSNIWQPPKIKLQESDVAGESSKKAALLFRNLNAFLGGPQVPLITV